MTPPANPKIINANPKTNACKHPGRDRHVDPPLFVPRRRLNADFAMISGKSRRLVVVKEDAKETYEICCNLWGEGGL